MKEISVRCLANTGILEIIIPSTAEAIKASAFEGCAKLEAVTFAADSRLQVIEDRAFCACP